MIKVERVKEIILTFINRLWGRIRRYKKTLTWITIVFITILILIVLFRSVYYLVIVYPVDQVSQLGVSNVSDKADLINKYRTTSIQLLATFAQIFGGIVVAVGIYFAWGNLTTAREGQITDRFTRAIDQLGNSSMEIRLGGIYALERIANESKKDYWPVMEILTAYVRKNSSFEVAANKKALYLDMDIQANKSKTNEIKKVGKVSLDIQAVLTVIIRRKNSFSHGEVNTLNLQMTCLQEADLRFAHLEGADLVDANLAGANLHKAHLKWAHLGGANLAGANLHKAHLKWAHLGGANLAGAFLGMANLDGAWLQFANLEGADLSVANLDRAYLVDANLEGANLHMAHLAGANLHMAHLEGVNLFLANLEGANLQFANLEGADLRFANLKGVRNLSVYHLSKVKTLYYAILDEELLVPLKKQYPDLFKPPD